jgi:hypothetical protein
MARQATTGGGRTPASTGAAPLGQQPVQLDQLKVIEAPTYFASSLQVIRAGNDFTLLFQRPRPATLPDGSPAPIAIAEPVALLQVSAATLKDISVLLQRMVAQVEQDYGPIETDFTRQIEAQNKS